MTTKTKAAVSREKLADAQATLRERRTEREEAVLAIEEIEAAWKSGDDSIPAHRLTELRDERKRLDLLVNAAEQTAKTAERLLVTDNPVLADAIAYALGGVYHGIDAQPVSERPTVDPEILVPELYVVQSKPHTEMGGGSLSGRCTIRLHRPSWAQPLNAESISKRLYEAGVRLKNDVQLQGNDIVLDVAYAFPEVPYLPGEPPKESDRAYGLHFADRMERQTYQYSYGGAVVGSTDGKGELVSTKVDEHGIRTTVADVSIVVSNVAAWHDMNAAAEMASNVMLAVEGEVVGVLGRVVDAEVVRQEPFTHPVSKASHRRITCRYTARSRTNLAA